MKQVDIDHWFKHHSPNVQQVAIYGALRGKAKELAQFFDAAVPDCADKTAAMRKLRETVMAMNLTVACYKEPEDGR